MKVYRREVAAGGGHHTSSGPEGSVRRWGGQLRMGWRKPNASRGGTWSGCGLLLQRQAGEASTASVSRRDMLVVRAVSVAVAVAEAESSFGFEVGEQQGGRQAA